MSGYAAHPATDSVVPGGLGIRRSRPNRVRRVLHQPPGAGQNPHLSTGRPYVLLGGLVERKPMAM